MAESSPYYESLKAKQQEVLFCYEPYDELVLMQLQQFNGYKLISVEKDMRDDKAASDLTNLGNLKQKLNYLLYSYYYIRSRSYTLFKVLLAEITYKIFLIEGPHSLNWKYVVFLNLLYTLFEGPIISYPFFRGSLDGE